MSSADASVPWQAFATVERPTKSDRTRARILDAAAAVFAEQGYGARLSDIAERAAIKTGSLYYHFESREELVAEILHRGIETSWLQVRAAVDSLPQSAPPIKRLETAIRAHTLSVLAISDYAAAQARIHGQVPPLLAEAHRRDQRDYGEYWNRLFEAAEAAGELAPNTDLFVARMLAFGAMNWTAEWFRPGAGRDPAIVAEQMAAIFVGGVRGNRTA
jgi:TetR/AcrR family transcriptional regulator, cholesterol catabolism regulator